ncbi:MAG: hypothetical protein QXR06_04970 [Candidatus Bathyarchaeia archaeon]|nr:hypothetical protein [Candidatus Bathyarchaeota archaeon]
MVKKEIHSSGKPNRSIILVALLGTLQSAGRIVFGYLSTITPGGLLDVEVAPIIIQFINAMFFLLGILGFIAVVGLLMMRRWGFWATVFVSVLTILFDIWGVTIQFTAAMGFVVPVISLLILLVKKSQLLGSMK